MSQISFKYFLLLAVLCSVGLCRPADDDGLIPERKGGPQASADYALDEEGVENEDGEEPEEEERPSGPLPTIRNVDQEIRVDEGYSVNLPCEVQNAEQYVTVWRNGTNIIYQEKTALTKEPHRVFLKDYNLQILNVTRYDSGLYTCAVLANNGGPKVSHRLHVNEAAKIDQFLPRGPKHIIEKGKSLSLICHASGYPQPNVFWNRRVKGSNTPERLDGTNYTIPSVSREHSGIYECIAKNSNDKPDKQSVEILVQYAPEVSIRSDTVNTAEGKVSEMHCTVYAEPPASLMWLKDDKVLQSNDHIKLYQDPNKHHRHILKIENTKAEDFGTYYCIANNSLGTTRKPISLSGTPLRPIFERASMAGDNRSPRLVWTVESLSQIKSYELLYRRQEADAETWLTVSPKVLPSPDGIHYTVVHDLYGLEPGTYEAVLRAQNAYGWSNPSPPRLFSGEDNMSNEIQQGPLEPNPNNASQLRISLALVLSIVVAMVYC